MQHDEQLASLLRRTVQSILTRGLNDPRVKGLVSVTDVRVSPDGRAATVLVSVEPAEHEQLTMHGLQHAARHIRWQVAQTTRLRFTPQLSFKLDRSLKKQAEVLQAIQRGRRRDAELPDGIADEGSGVDPPEEP